MPRDSFRFPAELGRRLRRLRQAAGLSQTRVAERMGRAGAGRANICARVETGRVKYPTLALIADYLRACRAGFGDVIDVLNAYTGRPPADETPGREAVRRLVRNLPARTASRVWRYDVKTTADRRNRGLKPLPARRRLARSQKLAQRQAEYDQVSLLLQGLERRPGTAGTMIQRQLARTYGHNVWGILRRTRGEKLDKRLPLLGKARQFALAQGVLSEDRLQSIQDAVVELFRREELAGRREAAPVRARGPRKGPRPSRRPELPPEMKQREVAVAVALLEANRPLMAEGADLETQARWGRWLRGLADVGLETDAGSARREARTAELTPSAPDPARAPALAALFFSVLDTSKPKQ